MTDGDQKEPILNIEGRLVALGPARRDLVPAYQRWFNDFETLRTLNVTPRPMTHEQEMKWYESSTGSEKNVAFTVYELATLRPIGNTTLSSIDFRNRRAHFAAVIGEPDCRGKVYGTEAIMLTLDYAFTALGLRNVMVRILESNPASIRAHQKAGFREFGRRSKCRISGGKAQDEVHMEALSDAFESPVLRQVFSEDLEQERPRDE